VSCSVLQCGEVCCSELLSFEAVGCQINHCTFSCVAVCCSVLQCVAVCCSEL